MGGKLKDDGGILNGGLSGIVAALNSAGIPTVPTYDWAQAVAWVENVDQGGVEHPLQFVTFTVSTDWDAPGGNENDLSSVSSVLEAAFAATSVRHLLYWGPGSDTTQRNVLVINGALIAMTAGWTIV